ncbi:hypothetical protein [Klebsiella pneumoniae]
MLKILIGDITEHKRDGLIWSIIITSITTILAGIFIIPLLKDDSSNLKYFAIFLAILNTYISTIVARIAISIYEYCKKKDRDKIINESPQSNSRIIKRLQKEKSEAPLKSYQKRYGVDK